MNTTKNLILAGALLAFGGIAQQAAAAPTPIRDKASSSRLGGAPTPSTAGGGPVSRKVLSGTQDHGSRLSAKGHYRWYDGVFGRFCVESNASGAALNISPIANC